MSRMTIFIDAEGLPSDPAVRTFLQALAQRGASTSSHDAGAIVEATRSGRRTAVAWLDMAQMQAIEERGWIAPSAADGSYRLTSAGKSIVRLMKAGPSPLQATSPMPSAAPATPNADPESPLAWLRARRNRDGGLLLSEQAYNAGERLRADFARSHLMPRMTVDWEAIPRTRDEQRGDGMRVRERSGTAADAAERVRKALASLPPELAGLAFDVCCLEQRLPDAERGQGAPQRSGHYLLSIALAVLARHYGLLPPVDMTWPRGPTIRHWGMPDYRPTIDGKRYC